MIANLFRERFHQTRHGRLGCGEHRKIGSRVRRAGPAQHDDLARAPLDHLRQAPRGRRASPQHVGLDHLKPLFRFSLDERSDRPLDRRRRDQHVHAAEHHAHPIHGGADLFEIAHVGAQAQGGATRVFDLELGRVQFRLGARNQTNARAGRAKPKASRLPIPRPAPVIRTP